MEISQYCILQRHLPNNMIFDHPLIWVGGADAILIRLCWVWGTLGLGYEWLPWSAAEYEQPENVLLQRTHSSFLFPDINIECNILENEILGSQHTHTQTHGCFDWKNITKKNLFAKTHLWNPPEIILRLSTAQKSICSLKSRRWLCASTPPQPPGSYENNKTLLLVGIKCGYMGWIRD